MYNKKFTLIEFMIVIAILGIIAAIVIPPIRAHNQMESIEKNYPQMKAGTLSLSEKTQFHDDWMSIDSLIKNSSSSTSDNFSSRINELQLKYGNYNEITQQVEQKVEIKKVNNLKKDDELNKLKDKIKELEQKKIQSDL